MVAKIRAWLMAQLFIRGFRGVEDINWMTRTLEICYKQKILKESWSSFLTGIEGILKDAQGEVIDARKWKP